MSESGEPSHVDQSDELVTSFVKFQEVEKSASPRTLRNYTHALTTFRLFMGDRFHGWKECSAEDFRLWLFGLMKEEKARSTIRLYFSALRSFYKYLVHRQGLDSSPLNDVQLPKSERKLPVVLTQAQCVELLELPLKVELVSIIECKLNI